MTTWYWRFPRFPGVRGERREGRWDFYKDYAMEYGAAVLCITWFVVRGATGGATGIEFLNGLPPQLGRLGTRVSQVSQVSQLVSWSVGVGGCEACQCIAARAPAIHGPSRAVKLDTRASGQTVPRQENGPS